MNRLPIVPILLMLSLPVFGQLNLKAGYCLSFLNAPGHDAIIEMYNADQAASLTSPLNPLNLLHGLDLGFEYHWDSFTLEAGWRTKRNRQEASGLQNQQAFGNSLTFSMSSFYGGIVRYLGPVVRISASIEYNYTKMKLDFEEPSLRNNISDNGWGSTFSLGYVLKGRGSISFIIAPYVQLNWTDYNLAQLQSALTELVGPAGTEDYLNYGLTLYFLNGPR